MLNAQFTMLNLHVPGTWESLDMGPWALRHWALSIGHWALGIVSIFPNPSAPVLRQLFTDGLMIQDEVGGTERLEQERFVERTRGITTLPRRVDAHERHGRSDAPHHRSHAAALIRRPRGERLRGDVANDRRVHRVPVRGDGTCEGLIQPLIICI